MAKNEKTGDGHQNGALGSSTQVYNPLTGNYLKRDSSTGRFVDVKTDGKAFRGVTKEPRVINVHIPVPKVTAKKAEQSVIKTINRLAK